MTGALILLVLALTLLTLRQPLLVILLAAVAVVHIVWGKGQLDYIIEDMWISLDKELILSIPLFILCGAVEKIVDVCYSCYHEFEIDDPTGPGIRYNGCNAFKQGCTGGILTATESRHLMRKCRTEFSRWLTSFTQRRHGY